MKKDEVDWAKLWDKLEHPTICNGEECIDVTEREQVALDKFAVFLGKMNPPEDPRIGEKATKENDAKFSKFIASQFKYLDKQKVK